MSRTTARAAAISLAAFVGTVSTAAAQVPAPRPVPPVLSPISMPAPQAPVKPAEPANLQPPIAGAPDVKINLELPKPELVFRFESNVELGTRIKRELQAQYNIPVDLPLIPKITTPPPPPRANGPMQVLIEPSYVTHRRLFFEQKNTERAGWDFGLAQPIVSSLHFYKDIAIFPARMASNFLEPYDTSAGKCLPGSPTPLLWYPPEITLFGGTVGAAAIVGLAAIFP